MGNLHLVTGYTGENHVTAADDGALNCLIFGRENQILNDATSAYIISNNEIGVDGGADVLMCGRFIRIPASEIILSIDNGTQGYKRNDLIVCRYTKDITTGVEDANLVVLKGTPTTGAPDDPQYSDCINDSGDTTQADFPLFRVPIDGLNVQEPELMYSDSYPIYHRINHLTGSAVPPARTVAGYPLSADITVAQLLAALTHSHSAADINAGTLDSSRLPTVPLTKGGTGAANGATGLKNLFAAGSTIISSKQYGTTLPTNPTEGQLFFHIV